MSNLSLPTRATAQEYRELLRGKETAKIAYATTLERRSLGVTIWHHDTPIFRLSDSGAIEIRAGGHVSATTTHRLHRLLQAANPRLGAGRQQGRLYLHVNPNPPEGSWYAQKYPEHRLELNPWAAYAITDDRDTQTITAEIRVGALPGYDAGHRTYIFQTH